MQRIKSFDDVTEKDIKDIFGDVVEKEYKGTCLVCGKEYKKGDYVVQELDGSSNSVHLKCFDRECLKNISAECIHIVN